jgi:hypothetical protein
MACIMALCRPKQPAVKYDWPNVEEEHGQAKTNPSISKADKATKNGKNGKAAPKTMQIFV